jgi:hypothetical protein
MNRNNKQPSSFTIVFGACESDIRKLCTSFQQLLGLFMKAWMDAFSWFMSQENRRTHLQVMGTRIISHPSYRKGSSKNTPPKWIKWTSLRRYWRKLSNELKNQAKKEYMVSNYLTQLYHKGRHGTERISERGIGRVTYRGEFP